jgi:hypothetical protein
MVLTRRPARPLPRAVAPAAAFGLLVAGTLGSGVLAVAGSARAYNYASPFAFGCHEDLSRRALRELRAELDAELTQLHADRVDRSWIDDLPLDLPRDMRDLAGASLIVGVRENDVKDHQGIDNAELAHVHGDVHAQREHCLRAPEHDEPDGSAHALDACREYIRAQARTAVMAGLDRDGRPDPALRLRVAVRLAFAGRREVPTQLAFVQLGRALHALQDSFAHSVRSRDALRVRVVLNWVDFANDRLVEARDGPAHRAPLDVCKDLDPLRALRRQRAIEASHALLAAVLAPAASNAARYAAIDDVLSRYLSYEPGCNADNDFCSAPELDYEIGGLGCALRRLSGGSPAAAYLLALCTLGLLLRRRARVRTALVIAASALWLYGATAARAQERSSEAKGPPSPLVQPDPRFALAARASGAIDEAAAAAALGARYRASKHVVLGLCSEWNPWASLDAERVRPGSWNTFLSLIWRVPVQEGLALQISTHAGASVLLFDLYGAPAGSVGPFVGISLLGLELALDDRLRLILEPADVAVPIPHLSGIPITHRQYRASVGLEWWL